MNEYEIHETILKNVCKEISLLAEKIQKTGGMSEQDLDKLDKLYHVKKDMLTAKAMVDAEEYENGGLSETRGRSPMTGRYVSRDGYDQGYSHGYSQAMNQMMNSGAGGNNEANGNSGHWPMRDPYYPEPRRW